MAPAEMRWSTRGLTFEFTRLRKRAKPAVAGRVQRRVRRHCITRLYDPPRCSGSCIAGIGCSRWLDEQQMRLFLGDGTVLYSLGNNEQLTRTEQDVALAHTNGDATFENKEEIIGVVMRVPDELA